jgi:hypothetical protein
MARNNKISSKARLEMKVENKGLDSDVDKRCKNRENHLPTSKGNCGSFQTWLTFVHNRTILLPIS